MDILPLKSLLDDDLDFADGYLIKLAKLHRSNFPVLDALVVLPPKKLISLITRLNLNSNDLDLHKKYLNQELTKITPHEDLIDHLKLKFSQTEIKSLWEKLLKDWLEDAKQDLRFGKLNLKAKPIFISKKILAEGYAWITKNNNFKDSIIEIKKGNLNPRQLKQLDDLALKMDKFLGINYMFHWILDKEGAIKISGISEVIDKISKTEILHPKNNFLSKSLPADLGHPIKVFAEIDKSQSGFSADGCLINGEDYADLDQKVLAILKAESYIPEGIILYKLSDLSHSDGSGSLLLIHNKSLLKEDIETILFIRNKKKLLNVSVLIPRVRSVDELLILKRDLASSGLTRKGSFKIWLEITVGENLLNLENYLLAGVDGVLINIDEMAASLGGFDLKGHDKHFYFKNTLALEKILEDSLKLLNKCKVQTLVKGSLLEKDEVLRFILEKGVGGIVVKQEGHKNLLENVGLTAKNVHKSLLN